jgi:hypothetical protein
MSPLPISWLAPVASRIVLESICEVTRKAILAGKFALMVPVMMLVGTLRSNHHMHAHARAFVSMRAMGISISLPAVMMRSPNSSITTTI